MFLIFKNATVGTSVIQVKAIDNDVGPNAAVLYRLKQDTVGNYRSFAIDQVSGLITVRQPLDRERQKIYDVSVCREKMSFVITDIHNPFQIRVEAYDQGVPPLSTDLDLTVYVRNVNDYEPQFLIDEIRVNFTGKFDGGQLEYTMSTRFFASSPNFIFFKNA